MLMERWFPFNLKSTEFKYLIIICVVIAHGSFYPYQLQRVSFQTLMHSLLVLGYTSLSDIAANILLFIPFGFIGVRAMKTPFKPAYYTVYVVVAGTFYAYIIQILQLYFGGRVPSMYDVFWNFVGTVLGGIIGTIPGLRFIAGKRGNELWVTVPLLLAGCWILSRLAPFVPSLDFGELKQSLKPLFFDHHLNVEGFLKHFVSWILYAHLLSAFLRRPLEPSLLCITMACVFCGQVSIQMRSISLHSASGAFTALVIWLFFNQKFRRRSPVLACLLLLVICFNGVYPFRFSGRNAMQWVPFYSYIVGNVNLWTIITIFEKIFLYGSLVWLFEEFTDKWIYSAVVTTSSVFAIEIMQIFLEGRTPEITDPVIVLLMALWVKQFRQTKHMTPRTRHEKEWSIQERGHYIRP